MDIEIKQLNFAYGDKQILNDISYNFKKGVTRISGENGSGKTSLLMCILGINEDYEGSVFINEQKINNKNQYFYNQYISFLINHNAFYPNLTVIENIEIFKYYYKIKSLSTHIEILIDSFGLPKLYMQRANQLSEGYKKKLAIILSLLNDAPIIILDEPFNFLDLKSCESLSNFINQSSIDNKTILIVAHEDSYMNLFTTYRSLFLQLF